MMMTNLADEASKNYAAHIAAVRARELPSSATELYFDAAAAPPAPRSVLDVVHARFVAGPSISNPHSNSPSGRRTLDDIDRARAYVCRELFGVERCGGVWQGQERDQKGTPQREPDQGWELAFTSGTTSGLEKVARAFVFRTETEASKNSNQAVHGEVSGRFGYLDQSHSSLYGLRDVARSRGAGVDPLCDEEEVTSWVQRQGNIEAPSLLALPLQCNATGKRYHRLVNAALEARRLVEARTGSRRIYILLDAAAYLSPSTRLALNNESAHQADYVAFSFIKIMGYPSGLGGLLFQRAAFPALAGKTYYGGGTLEASTSRIQWRKPMRELYEALEDGTQNLFGILAIEPALKTLRTNDLLGDWGAASDYTSHLTAQAHRLLSGLKHADGSELLEVYTERPAGCQAATLSYDHITLPSLNSGPTVLFNVLRARSSMPDADLQSRRIDPTEVDSLACIEDIHLRSGRMCNVGAITHALTISEDDIVSLWERGIGCGSAHAGGRQLERKQLEPQEEARLQALVSGALRISLSAWNTPDDIGRLCGFLMKHFCSCETLANDDEDDFVSCASDDDAEAPFSSGDDASSTLSQESRTQASSRTSHSAAMGDAHAVQGNAEHYLREVHIYPIKSCASQRVRGPWRLYETGLEHDRSMCIVDLDSGKVLSQKRLPSMARIRPLIRPDSSVLSISFIDASGMVERQLTVPRFENGGLTEQAQKERAFDMCGASMSPLPILDAEVREAFSTFLGRNCTLARQPWGTTRRADAAVPLLLSNESPYLMITAESVEQVRTWMCDEEGRECESERVGLAFRANFVVSSTSTTNVNGPTSVSTGTIPIAPFYEDGLARLGIGPHTFAALGPCRRCEMIALDPVDGTPVPQLLSVVARHRRETSGRLRGRVLFGQHLVLRQGGAATTDAPLYIKEGMAVRLD